MVRFPVFAARSGSRSVQCPLTAPAWKPKKEDEQSPDASKRGSQGAAADTGCLKVVSSADLHPVSLEQWGDLVFTAELTLNSSGGFGRGEGGFVLCALDHLMAQMFAQPSSAVSSSPPLCHSQPTSL